MPARGTGMLAQDLIGPTGCRLVWKTICSNEGSEVIIGGGHGGGSDEGKACRSGTLPAIGKTYGSAWMRRFGSMSVAASQPQGM
jgi:hypothetical protein